MGLVPAKSPWLRIEAILLIVLGVIALIMPLFAGVALTLTLGLILTAAGLIGLISAVAGRHHIHLGWSLASAILALLLGLFLLIFPLAAAVVLAVLIGAYLLFDGVTIIGLAVNRRNRGDKPWGWLLAAGIADLVLAVFSHHVGRAGRSEPDRHCPGDRSDLRGGSALHHPREWPEARAVQLDLGRHDDSGRLSVREACGAVEVTLALCLFAAERQSA